MVNNKILHLTCLSLKELGAPENGGAKNGAESESPDYPVKPEDSDVEVEVIEEEMNLEELMKQKVCSKV